LLKGKAEFARGNKMSRTMFFGLPNAAGTSALATGSPTLIVTDGPHRLVSTTPVPVQVGIGTPAQDAPAKPSQDPFDVSGWHPAPDLFGPIYR
jgi:hypothetical protein